MCTTVGYSLRRYASFVWGFAAGNQGSLLSFSESQFASEGFSYTKLSVLRCLDGADPCPIVLGATPAAQRGIVLATLLDVCWVLEDHPRPEVNRLRP